MNELIGVSNTKIPFLLFDCNNRIYIPEIETSAIEMWMSKIAFYHKKSDNNALVTNILQGDHFFIDKAQQKVYLPRGASEGTISYLIRVAVDYFEVCLGSLPLHAAAIAVEKCQIIIVAKSGGGKSYISKLLIEEIPGSFVIGDDHIILHDSYIQGNGCMRSRSPVTNDYIYIRNHMYDHRKPLIICCFSNDGDAGFCEFLMEKDEIFERMKHFSAFKYLTDEIKINGSCNCEDNFWRNDIIGRYIHMVLDMLSEVKVVSIRGTCEYAAEQIKSIIADENNVYHLKKKEGTQVKKYIFSDFICNLNSKKVTRFKWCG